MAKCNRPHADLAPEAVQKELADNTLSQLLKEHLPNPNRYPKGSTVQAHKCKVALLKMGRALTSLGSFLSASTMTGVLRALSSYRNHRPSG